MTITNTISGEVRRLPLDQFLQMADPEIRDRIIGMLARPSPRASGVMCYEVLQMDSLQCGHRSFVVFGPDCTYKDAAEAAKGRLGDVPSRFAYPVAYHEKETTTNGTQEEEAKGAP